MNPRVVNVTANDDYTLTLAFSNGEVGLFDVTPYLDKGIFRELRDTSYFNSARVVLGTVQWPHEQDFCPDTLYEESRKMAGRFFREAGYEPAVICTPEELGGNL